MATSSTMTYQQPPYQSTVNVPVVVQPVRPVVIPVVTRQDLESNMEDGGCHACAACCGILGGFFIVCFVIVLAIVRGDGGSRIYKPMVVLGSLGGICSVLGCCFYAIAENSSDGRRQEIHNNTQPVSEPFTQNQMNQGSSMYVPVQSGPSAPYYAQMSNVQQPFQHGVEAATGSSMYVPMQSGPSAPYYAQMSNVQQKPLQHGVDTATGAPQNFGSKQYTPQL